MIQANEGREVREFPSGTDVRIQWAHERVDCITPNGNVYALHFPRFSRISVRETPGAVRITIDKPKR